MLAPELSHVNELCKAFFVYCVNERLVSLWFYFINFIFVSFRAGLQLLIGNRQSMALFSNFLLSNIDSSLLFFYRILFINGARQNSIGGILPPLLCLRPCFSGKCPDTVKSNRVKQTRYTRMELEIASCDHDHRK